MAVGDDNNEEGKGKRTILRTMKDFGDATVDILKDMKQGIGHTVRSGGAELTSGETMVGNLGRKMYRGVTGVFNDPDQEAASMKQTLQDQEKRLGTREKAYETMEHEVAAKRISREAREMEKEIIRPLDDEFRDNLKNINKAVEEHRGEKDYAGLSDNQIKIKLIEQLEEEYKQRKKEAQQEIDEKIRSRKIEEGLMTGEEKEPGSPAQGNKIDRQALDKCASFEEAAQVLKKSGGKKFTLAEESTYNKTTGDGLKVFDHPDFPAKQPEDNKLTKEEYQAERLAHQVTYVMENGKVAEVISGEKANFVAAVENTLVQKRGEEITTQFGKVKASIAKPGEEQGRESFRESEVPKLVGRGPVQMDRKALFGRDSFSFTSRDTESERASSSLDNDMLQDARRAASQAAPGGGAVKGNVTVNPGAAIGEKKGTTPPPVPEGGAVKGKETVDPGAAIGEKKGTTPPPVPEGGAVKGKETVDPDMNEVKWMVKTAEQLAEQTYQYQNPEKYEALVAARDAAKDPDNLEAQKTMHKLDMEVQSLARDKIVDGIVDTSRTGAGERADYDACMKHFDEKGRDSASKLAEVEARLSEREANLKGASMPDAATKRTIDERLAEQKEAKMAEGKPKEAPFSQASLKPAHSMPDAATEWTIDERLAKQKEAKMAEGKPKEAPFSQASLKPAQKQKELEDEKLRNKLDEVKERRSPEERAQIDKMFGEGKWDDEKRAEVRKFIAATKESAKGANEQGTSKGEDVGRGAAVAAQTTTNALPKDAGKGAAVV